MYIEKLYKNGYIEIMDDRIVYKEYEGHFKGRNLPGYDDEMIGGR